MTPTIRYLVLLWGVVVVKQSVLNVLANVDKLLLREVVYVVQSHADSANALDMMAKILMWDMMMRTLMNRKNKVVGMMKVDLISSPMIHMLQLT